MRKYLLLLVPLLFLACENNNFQFTENVTAKVIGTSSRYIGIQYELYGKKIFQDIYIPGYAEITYYSKMKTIPLQVFVKGSDFEWDKVFITLMYNGSLFGKKDFVYDKLSMNDFMSIDTDIPTFKWYVYDEQIYEDGISPQELRAKLAESGEKTPETKSTVTIEDKKGDL
jgi:hypothetical protein